MMQQRNKIVTIICFLGISGCQMTAQKAQDLERPAPKMQAASVQNEILAADMSFNVETGEIKYTLPQPALVRLRIGLPNGGALLSNIVDWEPREKGPHIEVWDHRDSSGQVNFGSRSDYLIVLACLPVNPGGREKYAGDIKGFRKAPNFEITFPESLEKTEDGTAVVTGTAPVRILIDEKDKKWLTETRYEMGLFIDQIYLSEDEEGTNPFTYLLNTTGLNEGPHVLTVNIAGLEGEVGTKSAMIYVKNVRKP